MIPHIKNKRKVPLKKSLIMRTARHDRGSELQALKVIVASTQVTLSRGLMTESMSTQQNHNQMYPKNVLGSSLGLESKFERTFPTEIGLALPENMNILSGTFMIKEC